MAKHIYLILISFFYCSALDPSLMDSVSSLNQLSEDVKKTNAQVPLYSNLIEYNAIQKTLAEKEIVNQEIVINKKNKNYFNKKKQAELFSNKIFDQKISFCSQDSNLKDLFFLITKQIGFNSIVDASVKNSFIGNISFENVSIGDVLKKLCAYHDPQLAIDINGDTIFISIADHLHKNWDRSRSLDHSTKILELKHLTIDDKFEKKIKEIWNNLVKNIPEEETFLTLDAEHRLLIMQGPAESIQSFEDIICKIDKKIYQVRIDAIILLAQKAFNFDVGINWSGIYNKNTCLRSCPENFNFVGLGGRLPDFPTPTKSDFPNNNNLLVNPLNFALNLFNKSLLLPAINHANQDIDASFIKIPFVFGGPDLNLERLNLVLNAAEHEARVKIISRPSILSNDGEIAHIVIGESLPLNTTIEDVVQTVVRNSSSVHYKDVGIVLKVIPKVTPNCDIFLDLAIEEADVISGSTRTNSVGIMENPPVINFIRTYNKVILKDKHTTVIGGLRGVKKQNSNNYVPILSKIPILGWFFKAHFEYQEDLERYIFITATLV